MPLDNVPDRVAVKRRAVMHERVGVAFELTLEAFHNTGRVVDRQLMVAVAGRALSPPVLTLAFEIEAKLLS